jgi:hypothetical protein
LNERYIDRCRRSERRDAKKERVVEYKMTHAIHVSDVGAIVQKRQYIVKVAVFGSDQHLASIPNVYETMVFDADTQNFD